MPATKPPTCITFPLRWDYPDDPTYILDAGGNIVGDRVEPLYLNDTPYRARGWGWICYGPGAQYQWFTWTEFFSARVVQSMTPIEVLEALNATY